MIKAYSKYPLKHNVNISFILYHAILPYQSNGTHRTCNGIMLCSRSTGQKYKATLFQQKTLGHKIFSMIAFIFDVFFYHTPFTWSLRCSYKAIGYIAKTRNKTTIHWNNNSLAALKSPLQNWMILLTSLDLA